MDVVSLAPVPVTSATRQLRDGSWTLTLTCKLTVLLRPGESTLAKRHDPIHDAELAVLAAHRRPGVAVLVDARSLSAEARAGAAIKLAEERIALAFDERGTARSTARMLSSDVALELTGLHPDHPRLATRLPDVVPQLFIERAPAERVEELAHADAIAIDAARGVCAIFWRAQVPLARADEPGKLWVAIAGVARRLSDAQLRQLLDALKGPPPHAGDGASEATQRSRRARRSDTATALLDPGQLDAAQHDAAQHDAALDDPRERTSGALPLRAPDGSPPWLKPASAPSLAGPASATPSGSTPGAALAVPPARASLWSRPSATLPGIGVEEAPTPASLAPHAPATSVAPVKAATPAPAFVIPPAAARTPSRAKDIVELLWLDRAATKKLRSRFASECEELEFAPRDRHHDLDTDDRELARDHHAHFGLLMSVTPIGAPELRERLREAVSESGRFTPPLVAVQGELSLPFDPIEILRATSAAVAPIAADDKKLKEGLVKVDELLASPLAAVAADGTSHVLDHLRKLYRESRRQLPPNHLDELVERTMLEQRRYMRRTLLGGAFLRAVIALPAGGTRELLPVYLPAELAEKLPMMTSFRARVLAEAHLRQDQYESCRHALRAVTLGRVVEL